MELDETDRKLLNIIQDDAKLPYAKIARKLGVSTSGVHKRIKRLTESGAIKRFVAVVDPGVVGKKLKAFIGVSTEPGKCDEVRPVLIARGDILEVHEAAGEHDLFVKLITEDTERLNTLLHELDRIPGVASTRTIIVLKTEKETGAVKL